MIASRFSDPVVDETESTLSWMQSVLMNKLNAIVPSPVSSATPSTSALIRYQTQIGGNGNINSVKVLILEHEMRTGDYLGEERFSTLSEIVSVKIKYLVEGEDDEKYQFWIMKVPQSTEEERHLVRIGCLDKREISFYTEILPTMEMWIASQNLDEQIKLQIPLCLYGKYNRSLDDCPVEDPLFNVLDCEYLLVLEDLRPKEFGKRHFSVGMSIAELMAVVEEIAKFHAVTWCMEEVSQDNLQWDNLYNWKNSSAFYYVLISEGLPILQDFLKDYNDADSQKILDRVQIALSKKNLRTKLHSLLRPAESPSPTCLIHMDLWSENILFRVKQEDNNATTDVDEADVEAYIIDWQVVAAGRPTHDLAILFFTSLSPETRRKYTTQMLQYYYDVFQRTANLFDLKTTFSFEIIQEEFRQSALLAVLLSIGSIRIAMLEHSTQTRLFEALRDLLEEDII